MRISIVKHILQFIFILSLSVTLIINYYDRSNPWGDWYYDPGPWCEKERTDQWIREPSNSIVDFLFLGVSLYLVYQYIQDIKTENYQNVSGYTNVIQQNPGLTLLGAIFHFIHFSGTFINHACRCHPGHQLDVVGMYSIALYPGLIWLIQYYVSSKQNNLSGKLNLNEWIVIIFTVICIFIYFIWVSDYYYSNPTWETMEVSSMFVIVGFALSMDRLVRVKFKAQFNTKKFGLAVLMLAIAFVAHRCDMEGIFCIPESYIQGHAIWHAASSYTVYIMYDYQRSAKIEGIKDRKLQE